MSSDTMESAHQTAQQAAGQAQAKLREQWEQRATQATEQINQQASDLRSVGEALREQGKDGPAKAADRLAGYAERVGGYLSEKDADALLSDAEEFGRNRPWAVAAGGLALGFAASRFLKASSRGRYQSRAADARAPLPAEMAPAAPDITRTPPGASAGPGSRPRPAPPSAPPRRSTVRPSSLAQGSEVGI